MYQVIDLKSPESPTHHMLHAIDRKAYDDATQFEGLIKSMTAASALDTQHELKRIYTRVFRRCARASTLDQPWAKSLLAAMHTRINFLSASPCLIPPTKLPPYLQRQYIIFRKGLDDAKTRQPNPWA